MVEQAVRLGRDLAKVYYYTPWQKGWPVYEDAALGEGLENITRENEFFKRLDQVDLVMFADVGFGDLAHWLKKKGHKVFGAAKAEELELDRFLLHDRLIDVGAPVSKVISIKGTDNLRKQISQHPGKWIKMNIFRGNANTFFARDVKAIEQKLCKLEFEMGPHAQELPFMVCDPIDGIETGMDGFFGGCTFPRPMLWGFMQDTTYLGKYSWNLPLVLEKNMKQLTGLLNAYSYRGPISTEVRTNDGIKGFLTDLTCRFANPLAAIHTEGIKNYTEVICQIAEGIEPVIQPRAEYAGCALLSTYEPEKTWEYLDLGGAPRNRVKLMRAAKYQGRYYAVKGEQNGFIIIGLGHSLQAVIDEIQEIGAKVSASELEKESLGHLDKHLEDLKDAEEMGIFLNGSNS
jgi:hypothetical protein